MVDTSCWGLIPFAIFSPMSKADWKDKLYVLTKFISGSLLSIPFSKCWLVSVVIVLSGIFRSPNYLLEAIDDADVGRRYFHLQPGVYVFSQFHKLYENEMMSVCPLLPVMVQLTTRPYTVEKFTFLPYLEPQWLFLLIGILTQDDIKVYLVWAFIGKNPLVFAACCSCRLRFILRSACVQTHHVGWMQFSISFFFEVNSFCLQVLHSRYAN